jgi:hypothetical protein
MRSPSPAFTLLWPTAGGVQALDELAALGLDSSPRRPVLPNYAGEGNLALYSLSTGTNYRSGHTPSSSKPFEFAYKPDSPRIEKKGQRDRPRKYEFRRRALNHIHRPRGAQHTSFHQTARRRHGSSSSQKARRKQRRLFRKESRASRFSVSVIGSTTLGERASHSKSSLRSTGPILDRDLLR